MNYRGTKIPEHWYKKWNSRMMYNENAEQKITSKLLWEKKKKIKMPSALNCMRHSNYEVSSQGHHFLENIFLIYSLATVLCLKAVPYYTREKFFRKENFPF